MQCQLISSYNSGIPRYALGYITLGLAITPMSAFLDFLGQDFSRADLIALAALAVAGLSAVYARRQSNEARKSRLSAEKEARRPQRLELYRTMEDYCRYCSKYYTTYLQGETTGTRNLTARISDFKRAMEHGAIHDMPGVAAQAKLLDSMGWQMQRHLDRFGNRTTVMQRGTEAKDDERAVENLVESFEEQRKALRGVFAPYLHTDGEA